MGCLAKKKYGILFETRLRALELKVSKLKCANNKGLEKHLLTLSACFANLKKAGHPYSDERKRLTLLNSLLTMMTGNRCISPECTLILLMRSVLMLWNLRWNV